MVFTERLNILKTIVDFFSTLIILLNDDFFLTTKCAVYFTTFLSSIHTEFSAAEKVTALPYTS